MPVTPQSQNQTILCHSPSATTETVPLRLLNVLPLLCLLEALLASPFPASQWHATPSITSFSKHPVPSLVASSPVLLCQWLLFRRPSCLLTAQLTSPSISSACRWPLVSDSAPGPWSGAQSSMSSGLLSHGHLEFNLSQKDLVLSALYLWHLQPHPPAGNREPPFVQTPRTDLSVSSLALQLHSIRYAPVAQGPSGAPHHRRTESKWLSRLIRSFSSWFLLRWQAQQLVPPPPPSLWAPASLLQEGIAHRPEKALPFFLPLANSRSVFSLRYCLLSSREPCARCPGGLSCLSPCTCLAHISSCTGLVHCFSLLECISVSPRLLEPCVQEPCSCCFRCTLEAWNRRRCINIC